MIKRAAHKSFSVIMAFLVLFSTVSITIESHMCGGVLVDVSVFKEVEKCKMEAFEMEQMSVTKQNCCKDQLEVLKGQENLKLASPEDLHIEQQFLITSFLYSFTNLFEGLPMQIIPHKDYSPPNLIADLQVLDQVFII